MNTLEQLNTRSASSFEFADSRPATVVFDRVRNLYVLDRVLDISSTSVTVTPNIEIQEIVNYSTAAVEFVVTVNDIPGATVSWDDLSDNLTLNQVGNTYTITGFESAQDWETAREFTWTLPVGYASDDLFWLDVAINYYDEELDETVTVNWAVYDPDHYYVAQLYANATVDTSAGKLINATANLEAEFNLIELSVFMDVTTTITATGEVIQIELSDATGNIDYTTDVDFYLSNTPLIVRPDTTNMKMFITPSDTSAISTITDNVGYPLDVNLINETNLGINFSDYGFKALAATDNYVLSNEVTSTSPTYTYKSRLYSSSGTLIKERDTSSGSVNTTFVTQSYYYIGDGKFYQTSNGNAATFEITSNELACMSDDYWCQVSSTHGYYGSEFTQFEVFDFNTQTSQISGSAFSTNYVRPITFTDNYLITLERTGSPTTYNQWVRAISLSTGNIVYSKQFTAYDFRIMGIAANNEYLVIGYTDDDLPGGYVDYSTAKVNVYNISTGNLVNTFSVDVDYSFSLELNSNNQLLVKEGVSGSSSTYNNVKIYHIESENLLHTFVGDSDDVVLTDTYVFRGGTSQNRIYRYELEEVPYSTIDNVTKVITIEGSTTEINNILQNDKITVTPSPGYSSAFTLTYVGERGDGIQSDSKTQNIV
jgi:hypothetical protein